jgi:hypothetical protein
MSAGAISAFHAYIRQRGAGLGRSFGTFLLLPFNLTFHTSNFHGAGGIGLCPLALAPLGILASRKNAAGVLVLRMFLLVVLWFFTQQESRFLIHAYVLSAIFAVLGWRALLANGEPLAKHLAATIVFLSCFYGLFMILKNGSAACPGAIFVPVRGCQARSYHSLPREFRLFESR